ncbi:MAG TPA: GntR family transcriptional regulator, partial [Aggregatilineaceae bacterium]|nr:GntR family transcriptional regulator [Aggregatilineaceae bacterium]
MCSPVYIQLKENLLAAIARGEYQPGDRLPSQRALCKQYGVSHMTVRRVINELLLQRVVYSVTGKGLYVAEPKHPAEVNSLTGFVNHMARLGYIPSTRVLEAKQIHAPFLVARALEIEVDAPIIYLRRLRIANDQPMAVAACYVPRQLCPGLLAHDFAKESLFDIFSTQYGLQPTSSISTIEARLADEEEAELLDLRLPAALLYKEQITFAQNRQPIELSRSVIRGDQYHL